MGRSLLFILLLCFSVAIFAQSELFFSEYVEGSSYNKALEIYNGTGTAVDLGAGNYVVEFYFNGASSPGKTITLSGTVANSDVFVLAHSSADAAIIAQADQTIGGAWFNGDDAIVLRKAGVVIDAIGQVGVDPGSEWGSGLTSTKDNTLRRKASVCQGDTDETDTFDPSLEWDGYAKNTFDGLGTHTVNCPPPQTDNTPPTCQLISYNPGPPSVIYIGEVKDSESGLASISVVQSTNVNVSWTSFTPGTTDPVTVTLTKIDNNQAAYVVIEVIDMAGNSQQCDPVYTTLSDIAPDRFELLPNFPNPFNPSTTIHFNIVSRNLGISPVSLIIYDITGKEVKTLINEPMQPGRYSVVWDGTDNKNQEVAGGVYIYRLVAGEFVASKKMVLLR